MGRRSRFRVSEPGVGPYAAAVAGAVLIALALSSTAQASIVVGSDLTEAAATPALASNCAPISAPCTTMLAGVKRGNPYPAASPASGTVIAFDVKTGGPGTIAFRLLRLDAAVAAKVLLVTGDGSGPTAALAGAGIYEFPADLPIGAGDYVGFDSSLFTAYGDCQQSAYTYGFSPPLPDRGSLQPPSGSGSCELLVNAVVIPSATVHFGKGSFNRASGKAKLGLELPGPGNLTLLGKGIGRVSRQVGRAGALDLPLAITAAARRKLTKNGSVKLRLSATFVPTGGTAATQSVAVVFSTRPLRSPLRSG